MGIYGKLDGVRKLTRVTVASLIGIAAALIAITGFFAFTFVIHDGGLKTYEFKGINMEPTLHRGDSIWVNKAAYRNKKIKRKDIVAIVMPKNIAPPGSSSTFLVSRVVALGGETISGVCDQDTSATKCDVTITVNSNVLDEPYLFNTSYAPFREIKVPEGYIFVMGDNRTNSEDSRYYGPIEQSSVIGKVARLP